MNYLLDKKYDETFTINFIGTEEFNSGDTLKLTMSECLNKINTFDGFVSTISGETSSVYLKTYYRYKCSGDVDWSTTYPIDELTDLKVCFDECIQIELLFFRVDDGGPNSGVTITLSNPSINGTYNLTTGDEFVLLTQDDPDQILEIGDFLKIFLITDLSIVSTADDTSYSIDYRFSQDGKLSWTEWERLTKENISTVHWDSTRFVEIQYLFKLNDNISNAKIYEVILYGDFQNASLNSMKINMFGLKENCVNIAFPTANIGEQTSGINDTPAYNSKTPDSTTLSLINEASEYQLRMNWLTQGLDCYSNPSGVNGMSIVEQLAAENAANSEGFWNPYEFKKITEWQNLLAEQISQMLGIQVEYHLTDPDGNGIDKVIHEHQLYNIVDYKMLKVLVPDNQFPDNQIVINQFNLDLFDTFKVHILKTEFKKVFGTVKRPSQEDILYFCQMNRMFIIKHAQIHKDVMNSGIYYDVVLEKYEKRANVINRIEESRYRIESLTINTTIDELFGFEEENDMKKVANKEQLKPKSIDKVRSVINAKTLIINEPIYNGDIKVIESYYNLFNVAQDEYAVEYTKADNELKVSDNRSFVFWFNLPNDYDVNKGISKSMISGYDIGPNEYVMLNNRTVDGVGYKIWLRLNQLFFTINDVVHIMDISLLTNVWYVLLINMNQRQQTCEMKILRRNAPITVTLYQPDTYEKLELDLIDDAADIAYETSVNGFKLVDNVEIISPEVNSSFITVTGYTQTDVELSEFVHDIDLKINGSKMKISNIRLFDDLIRDEYQNIVLNELIVKDAQHMILADNATKKIFTTNYPNKNWR